MKYKLSNGSALLLIFIISFVVSLAAIRCWQVSSLLCDVQYQRELFYKRFYLTNRILNAGIDLACKNFDTFLKLKKSTDVAMPIDMNFCLTELEIKNSNIAQLTVATVMSKKIKSDIPKPNRLLLTARLFNNNENVCKLRCLLERKKNENGVSFVVSHFTLSYSL